MSAGSCFWLPRGAIIYNRLQDFLRKEYRKRGFKEVVGPNIYNSQLWKTSGHWDHYSDDIFKFDGEFLIFLRYLCYSISVVTVRYSYSLVLF